MLSVSDAVFLHSNYKVHLYDIIRESMRNKDDTVLLADRLRQNVRSTKALLLDEQSSSDDNAEENKLEERNSWDSGEDHYFKWAALNRRPMESLAGRKRSGETTIGGQKQGRINGGIWRSGLVG